MYIYIYIYIYIFHSQKRRKKNLFPFSITWLSDKPMNGTNEFQIYGEIVDGNCLYSENFQKDWKNRPLWLQCYIILALYHWNSSNCAL